MQSACSSPPIGPFSVSVLPLSRWFLSNGPRLRRLVFYLRLILSYLIPSANFSLGTGKNRTLLCRRLTYKIPKLVYIFRRHYFTNALGLPGWFRCACSELFFFLTTETDECIATSGFLTRKERSRVFRNSERYYITCGANHQKIDTCLTILSLAAEQKN